MNIHKQTNKLAATINWTTFYDDYQKEVSCIGLAYTQITPQRAIFRGLVQDLATVKKLIEESGCNPDIIIIYADVFVSSNINWIPNTSTLLIYARRVEFSAEVSIQFKKAFSEASLVLYSSEWEGKLKVMRIDEPGKAITLSADITASSPGILVKLVENSITSQATEYKHGITMGTNEQLELYLSNLFIAATLLYSDHPSIAMSILLWIKHWAAMLKNNEMLYYRCLSLSNQLQGEIDASLKASHFVPFLTKNVYEGLAATFVKEINDYENRYLHLLTQTALTQENIETIKGMINISESETRYIKSLLDQAIENYENAQHAVSTSKTNFKEQAETVERLAIFFEQEGIPQYKRDQIIKGIVSLVTASTQFGTGIASIVVAGSPSGAGAAAASVSNAVKAVDGVAKAAETAKEVAQVAEKTAKTMKDLQELVKFILSIYEFAKKIASFVNNMQQSTKNKDIIRKMETLTDASALNATDTWDIYILQLDNIMADPKSKGIKYAAEYKEALDILAIRGKSLCKAQLSAIKTCQEMMSIAFQFEYTKQKKKELEELVLKLQAGQEIPLKVMQLLSQKYIDSKSSLFCALKSYQSSYYYWAFRESNIKPRIVNRIGPFTEDMQNMTKIVMDTKQALEEFAPNPPQPLKNGVYNITDQSIIDNLKKTKKVTWNMPLDTEDLRGFGRVRLDTIRVWIEGVKFTSKDRTILIHIKNSGNYVDRFKGKLYQFTSRPLERSFKYEVTTQRKGSAHVFDDGTYGLVKLDGQVDKEVAYAYFQPTPFSEWTISIEDSSVDLSKINRITFWFKGTAIPYK